MSRRLTLCRALCFVITVALGRPFVRPAESLGKDDAVTVPKAARHSRER